MYELIFNINPAIDIKKINSVEKLFFNGIDIQKRYIHIIFGFCVEATFNYKEFFEFRYKFIINYYAIH